ncbi:hypothetical protein JOD54_000274 [Actinokineospora baliensis]|uniref:hypothetical protein n=1 Tax=Actinokineospora baliensis TaxID=547056 RepID=UPI00195E6B3D|nr:hypothetical protein [Actinokineospora baliensis]MBM7770070.1 hypothetical protein [Actinokineospora baliensis]
MSVIAPVTPPRLTVRAALPGALLVILFGVLALLAAIAPGRGDDGQIYAISIDNGQPDWPTIPRSALSCEMVGDTSTCAVDIAGKPLRASMTYTGSDRHISCTAQYDGYPVSCGASYDYTSTGVGAVALISDDLGVSADDLAGVAPWWAEVGTIADAGPVLVVVLAVGFGVVAGFGGRRPVNDHRPLLWLTGIGWVVLLVGSVFLLRGHVFLLIHPILLIAGGVLVWWQWTLTRPGHVLGIWRALGAFAATALASSVALLLFMLSGAFVD